MACMIEQGVVDLADPEGSSLIEHIGLGDPNSAVFSVDTERQAMLAWLGWGAACFGSTCGVIEDPCGSGDGAATTGHLPLGNCEENDSVAAFWDALMVVRRAKGHNAAPTPTVKSRACASEAAAGSPAATTPPASSTGHRRAPIDCRNDRPCDGDGDGACADGEACIADRGHSYCRLEGALCDPTYVNIVRFIQGLAACR
jgi:hypothetical protein